MCQLCSVTHCHNQTLSSWDFFALCALISSYFTTTLCVTFHMICCHHNTQPPLWVACYTHTIIHLLDVMYVVIYCQCHMPSYLSVLCVVIYSHNHTPPFLCALYVVIYCYDHTTPSMGVLCVVQHCLYHKTPSLDVLCVVLYSHYHIPF